MAKKHMKSCSLSLSLSLYTHTHILAMLRMSSILVPWPGIKLIPPAAEVQNVNQRSAREVLVLNVLLLLFTC